MQSIATAQYELCSHGRRYCHKCGTTIEPFPLQPESAWSEAWGIILAGRERAKKASKAER